MKNRRVKITGIGPVTPAGIGREAFLRGIFEPVSRVGVKVVGGELLSVAAAEVTDFRIGAFAVDARYLGGSRPMQFALAATVLALRDAGLALADVRRRKPLVVLAEPAAERGTLGATDTKPNQSKTTCEAVARQVGAQELEPGRPEFLSSLEAIGHAAMQVASGKVDLAICGGADAPWQGNLQAEMRSCGLSSGHAREPERQCRPFDLWRTTSVAGEGACIFVLEPEESPRRGYVFVAGAGSAREKHGKAWDGLGEALRLATGNARVRGAEIDCIHADGTGHKDLDLAEANALRAALGAHLDSVPVVAIKGAVGNALGASGAIQVGCAVLGLKHSIIAPTVNWQHPDPSCRLNLARAPRQMATRINLMTGRDSEGMLTCLILQQ